MFEVSKAVVQRCSVQGVFLWILRNFQERLFDRAPPVATSEVYSHHAKEILYVNTNLMGNPP